MYNTKIELIEICHKIAKEKYVTSHGGNLSCRIDDTVLITPTKTNKGDVTLQNLVEVDVRTGNTKFPYMKPTGELPFHLHLYKNRPDINCIVHAHPPILTGFAIARSRELEYAYLPEVAFELGSVQTVKYAEPCSDALAESFNDVLHKGNAFLMENHGITIVGCDGIKRCFEMLEMLEAQAQSIVVAKTLYGPAGVHKIEKRDLININNVMKNRNLKLPCKPGYVKELVDLFKV